MSKDDLKDIDKTIETENKRQQIKQLSKDKIANIKKQLQAKISNVGDKHIKRFNTERLRYFLSVSSVDYGQNKAIDLNECFEYCDMLQNATYDRNHKTDAIKRFIEINLLTETESKEMEQILFKSATLYNKDATRILQNSDNRKNNNIVKIKKSDILLINKIVLSEFLKEKTE